MHPTPKVQSLKSEDLGFSPKVTNLTVYPSTAAFVNDWWHNATHSHCPFHYPSNGTVTHVLKPQVFRYFALQCCTVDALLTRNLMWP